MDENLKKAYNELSNAFLMLSTEEKRQEIVNKLEEMVTVLNTLKENNINLGTITQQYQNEDEFLCYLNNIIYKLETSLGNLLSD